MTHIPISPAILYWGTPVCLLSSSNPNGSTNLAPMSSAWWLGNRCVLGLAAESQTPQNIRRNGEVVINLPSPDQLDAVNMLSSTTGTQEVPAKKIGRGYRYVHDKWELTGLTRQPSELVKPARIQECPIQMECTLVQTHSLMGDVPALEGFLVALEVTVRRVHVHPSLQMAGHPNRIDPDQLRLLFMAFQELYAIGTGKVGRSDLARVHEEKYRMPAVARGPTLEAERREEEEKVKAAATVLQVNGEGEELM